MTSQWHLCIATESVSVPTLLWFNLVVVQWLKCKCGVVGMFKANTLQYGAPEQSLIRYLHATSAHAYSI